MNTLALRPAEALAPSVAPKPLSRLLARFIQARETQAKRRVQLHFAAMGDARLRALGFTDDDIAALRAGELRLPRIANEY